MQYFWGLLLCSLALSAAAVADEDDSIFSPNGGVAGPVRVTGFKKIQPDDALNQISVDLEVGGLTSHSSDAAATELRNTYLAFAVDIRYLRNCYASKVTALCTFFHSGVQLSGNVTWSDDETAARYQIVAVPLEYVTGSFGKEGPDLKTTSGALFASIGARAEYLRDLGLEIEHRAIGVISASVNYSSPSQALSQSAGLRWIGSIRLFGGGGATDTSQLETQGAIVGGIETQLGLVLDLERGAVAFTNTSRTDGSIPIGGQGVSSSLNSDKIELKYMRSVCRGEKQGGCHAPRKFNYGGGVRYEYSTSSYEAHGLENGTLSQDRSVHRLILFAEIARF